MRRIAPNLLLVSLAVLSLGIMSSSLFSPAFADEKVSTEVKYDGGVADNFVQSGASKYRIPIEVPPGRQGLAPKLEIVYSSLSKNGIAGVGWDLDFGSIQRNTKGGLDYSEDRYLFCKNDSKQELVGRGDWGDDFFGAKIESSFRKYEKSGDSWIVYDKSGKKYYFGTTSGSRQYDPEDSDKIFMWRLDKIEDANGNYCSISYTTDNSYLFPEEVAYTSHAQGSSIYSVQFHYDDRSDSQDSYKTQFLVKCCKLLKTIVVKANGAIVSVYSLTHTSSSLTGCSLLESFTRYGNDVVLDSGYNIESGTSLPATEFTYTTFNLHGTDTQWAIKRADSAPSLDEGAVVDLNGDGKADFIYRKSNSLQMRALLSKGDEFKFGADDEWGTKNLWQRIKPLRGGVRGCQWRRFNGLRVSAG